MTPFKFDAEAAVAIGHYLNIYGAKCGYETRLLPNRFALPATGTGAIPKRVRFRNYLHRLFERILIVV
jgi:hypothetical protein